MRKRHVTIGLLAAVAASVAFPAAAADVGVERFQAIYHAVPTDAAQGDGLLMDDLGASLWKYGAGTWSISSANFSTNLTSSVRVVDGAASLSDTGVSRDASAVPPALSGKAAFWLVAGVNHVYTSETSSAVSRWYDCRETESGGVWGSVYPRAEARAMTQTNVVFYPFVDVSDDGRTKMNFGGYKSGMWMKFLSATDAAGSLDNCHIFLVHGVRNWFASVLGGTSSCHFHPGNYGGGSGSYISIHDPPPTALNGQFRLDGATIDPCGMAAAKGRHLLEYEAGGNSLATCNCLCNERNIANRYGGDDVYEVVFFTNRLNAAERLAISDYLLAKWGLGERTTPHLDVALNRGAELVVSDAATAGALSPHGGVTLSGAGTVVKRGADSRTLILGGRLAQGFDGDVRVEEGSAKVETHQLNYAFRSGDAVTVTKDTWSNTEFDTLVVSASSSAPAGTATKTGPGTLRVERLDAGVTNLSVSGGTVVLATPFVRAPDPAADWPHVEATFANPTFEPDITGFTGSKTEYSTLGTNTFYGWTVVIPVGKPTSDYYAIGLFKNDVSYFCPHRAPQGDYVLGLKWGTSFGTSVTIPEDGLYELTFFTSGRRGYGGSHMFEIQLQDQSGTEVVQTLGRLAPYSGTGYVISRYRTPSVVRAGTYRLWFQTLTMYDAVATFDDFHMVKVKPHSALGAWPVPNGDFENIEPASGSVASTTFRGVTSRGWTVASIDNAASDSDAYSGAVQLGESKNRFSAQGSRGGTMEMMLLGYNATATSDAFTVPDMPSGRYRLRCDASRAGGNGWLNGTMQMYSDPTLKLVLEVNGTEHVLANQTFHSRRLVSYLSPDAVTVPAGATLRVKVVNAKNTTYPTVSMLLVDNLELVSADAVDDLVKNGSLTTQKSGGGSGDAENWNRYTMNNSSVPGLAKSAASRVGTTSSSMLQNYVAYARPSGYNDNWFMHITQRGCFTQSIAFPDAGVYQIAFWAAGRYPPGYPTLNYSGNQVQAWLADPTGGTTNELGTTACLFSTNFVRYAFCFNVPAAGTYLLGIQGMNGPTRVSPTSVDDATAFVDNVSVRKVVAEGLDPSIGATTQLNLAEGTKLRLDFAGTVELGRLAVGGRGIAGEIDAARYPDLVSGPGSLYVKPRGTIMIFR